MKRQFLFVLTILLLGGLLISACAQPGAPTEAPAGESEEPAGEGAGDVPGTGGEVVQVATDATWPPFEYIDESTNEIVGFDIDLMKAIAERAGIEVEFVNVGWDALLAGVATCQYDAAISAMTITPERAKEFLFTEPYFEAGQIVSVRLENTDINSKDDLSGKVVGAQIGTTGAIEVEKIDGATLRTYDDVGLAFQALLNGQIDAVVADNPLALAYVGQNEDQLKTVGEVFTEENYGIAVCKNLTDLQATLNEGLAAVQAEGLVEEYQARWLEAAAE